MNPMVGTPATAIQRGRLSPTVRMAVLAFNVLAALITGSFGVQALVSPGSRDGIVGPVTADLAQYAVLYGVRSILISLAVLLLLAPLFRDRSIFGQALVPMLYLAAAVQIADMVYYLALGDLAHGLRILFPVAVHLIGAILLSRRSR